MRFEDNLTGFGAKLEEFASLLTGKLPAQPCSMEMQKACGLLWRVSISEDITGHGTRGCRSENLLTMT